jgi:hypothetical protein
MFPFDIDIYRCYPLFFTRECCHCGSKILRDTCWRFFTAPYCNGVGIERHLCCLCAPTKKDAKEFAEEGGWLSQKPKIPPPPQKRR